MSAFPEDETASQQIDGIIRGADDWRGATMSQLRRIIKATDPGIYEEVKWKKPSMPKGVPVWSYNGAIICVGNILKQSVRMTFPKGALVKDSEKLFNARLDSAATRAIDFHEGEPIDEGAFKAILVQAVELNS